MVNAQMPQDFAETGASEAALVVGANVFWLTGLRRASQNVREQFCAVFTANEQRNQLAAAMIEDAKDVVQLALGIFFAS